MNILKYRKRLTANFIKHAPSILLFIVLMVGFLILLSMLGINLKTSDTHHINKIVTVETFEIPKSKFSDGFCQKNASDPHKIEKDCNTLTEKNCKSTSCCIWAKTGSGHKCVAGGKLGHTFKTDDKGKDIDVDHYYHKDTCRGNCK